VRLCSVLARRLAYRVTNGDLMHPEFAKPHYPLYWHYDVLGGLTGLAELGPLSDERCTDALDLLESLRLACQRPLLPGVCEHRATSRLCQLGRHEYPPSRPVGHRRSPSGAPRRRPPPTVKPANINDCQPSRRHRRMRDVLTSAC
jgi:hypothetical protein